MLDAWPTHKMPVMVSKLCQISNIFYKMYVHPKNKLNAFKEVALPSNAQYFHKFGNLSTTVNMYSGDETDLPSGNKIDQIAHYLSINEVKLREESQPKDE